MPRKAKYFMLFYAFFIGMGYVILGARLDAKYAAGNQAISTMATCGSLRLGMTRDDVQRVMGAATREYQIEGPSGGLAVALRFELPIKEERFPLVVLERGRVVEAVCTEQHRLTATPEERAAMFAREEAQDVVVGSDGARR